MLLITSEVGRNENYKSSDKDVQKYTACDNIRQKIVIFFRKFEYFCCNYQRVVNRYFKLAIQHLEIKFKEY